MTPNDMPPRIKQVSESVVIEQIATEIVLGYDPLTQAGMAVMNFRGVLVVNDEVADLSGDKRTQVVLTTASHATEQYGTNLRDPVTGLDLSKLSAAGWMMYAKAMAASAYDKQLAKVNSQSADATDTESALPTRVEG